jgi:uncharacterized metal-binding protein YceD (DUF177 family)
VSGPWSIPIRLAEIDRGALRLAPEPDEATCARIADSIGVDAVKTLKAEATLKPWLDGVELSAHVVAVVTQTCGITLESFESILETRFTLQALPAGSPNALQDQGPVLVIDPEEDDPPEILDGEVIDLGDWLVEHLALEVEQFPRKPDAVFEQPGGAEVISPFAALAALKEPKPPH